MLQRSFHASCITIFSTRSVLAPEFIASPLQDWRADCFHITVGATSIIFRSSKDNPSNGVTGPFHKLQFITDPRCNL
jgi:hypothetical protein